MILLLIGTTSLVETSSARTLRFETWTTDLANQDLTLTPSGTGEVVTSSPFVIGGTSNNASALLQIDSTSQGVLPPRMTTAQRDAISTPAEGLVIHDTTTNKLNYYNGSSWIALESAGKQVKSALVTDGSATTTVSEDADNLINGNCTNGDNGNYVCTFQTVYAAAPHCWVSLVGDDEYNWEISTSTTQADIQFRAFVTPWETFTPTGSWTSNVTYSGAKRYVGNEMQVKTRIAISATIGPNTPLTLTVPDSLSINTLGGVLDDNLAVDGRGAYHDTGSIATAAGWRVIYNSGSTVKVVQSGNANVTQTAPVTWATGDEIGVTYSFPVSGADDNGPGVDTSFLLFCKGQ